MQRTSSCRWSWRLPLRWRMPTGRSWSTRSRTNPMQTSSTARVARPEAHARCAPQLCRLRASVPGVAYIQVPAGVYGITLPAVGPDGEDVGDFNLDAPVIANQRVEITGAGSAATIIDGNLRDRLFNVAVGRSATLRGLMLRNGRRTSLAPQVGGAITNDGVLAVDACVIESNAATGNGGGIYNRSNLLTITDSVLRANSGGLGGAISSFGACACCAARSVRMTAGPVAAASSRRRTRWCATASFPATTPPTVAASTRSRVRSWSTPR